MKITLDEQQKSAIHAARSGSNVFVTGVAGTGKSTLLNELCEYMDCAVTATTGIAAVNIGGSTLHSYFGVGLAREEAEVLAKKMFGPAKKRISKTKTLIIDEVSMLSCELFEKLEHVARIVRRNNEFFGGIQIIFFGDFLQLPPVQRGRDPKYCFESQSWTEANFELIELQTVYRQDDKEFVDILAQVRKGELSEEGEKTLLSCKYSPDSHPKDVTPVVLYSTNAEAKKRNDEKLAEINSKPYSYKIKKGGDEYKVESLIKNSRISENLELKKGAQ